MRTRIFVALGAVMFLGFSLSARAADKVTEKSSGEAREHKDATVVRDDRDGLAVRMKGGVELEFRREHVVDIDYECLRPHYAFGEAMFKQGQFDVARIRFEQAADDRNVSNWAMQYVLRRLAQCYQKSSREEDIRKAVEQWDKLQQLIPGGKGLFVREAVDGLIDGYSRLKEWDKASAALGVLEALGEEAKLMAKVYRAQLSERRGQFADAVEAYKIVSESRTPKPTDEVRAMALAGLARCSMESQGWANAKSAADAIIVMGERSQIPESALADAYQVRGEVALRNMLDIAANDLAGEKNEKRDKVLDGLADMLRPIVQYKTSTWAEQRALYYVGFWSEKLNQAGLEGEGTKWIARARSMYTTLRTGHPDSKWSKLAGERLEKMGLK